MADLISLARAKNSINQNSFTSAEDTTLTTLIAAISKAIRSYCGREFEVLTFDELRSGNGKEVLLLKERRIASVNRVALNPVDMLTITNTATANQRATITVTTTGLSLTRVASGTSSTDSSITWANYATLQAVKSAVDALGNGWAASFPDSQFALWPSADLRALQGALNARNRPAALQLHVEEVTDYEISEQHGWLRRAEGWPAGCNNIRVIYSAGHATVPEDIQEACSQWVAALFWQNKGHQAEGVDLPTPSIVALLDRHRRTLKRF